ncbi:hypothetical protein GNI_054540 [Gregarina niphandrodes]|uniref:Uncharacterized protein n=1 Tax=Gregarina niphandrodes TaxID=110365 RepID=A0A023B917_GRENI|nr:hypothetical protein GNI_054540 [Gregarina niphandrodes]EZG70701.1 hypothetical protein GNI_054540 [Gregarina niphandrodes]|eukprot:XP_011129884.1 hypothetical protein GNI_054540 [Gregarina niphandrodes]
MRTCRTSIRGVVHKDLVWLMAVSLFDDVRCPSLYEHETPTSFSIQDICAALTGRHEGVDVEGLRKELIRWNAVVKRLRPMEIDDVEVMGRLKVLDIMYQAYQSEKQAAQNTIRQHASQKAAQPGGGDRTDYGRMTELASEIRELLDKEDFQADASLAAKASELIASCKSSIQPKPLDVWATQHTADNGESSHEVVANRELLVAQVNHVNATNQMIAIRDNARRLVLQNASRMNTVLPSDRRQICGLLDLKDPVQGLPPQVEYLIENGKTIEAFVVSENRRNANKKLA